ncbi:MAG TPA: Rieske 2Fe-2S domain-containing protein [Candidatus Dormibacteraeota bacterium]|nr:Rieske 2Fe-2S domain-containing protein [Candidatus Dormibacteraeota bacterium]
MQPYGEVRGPPIGEMSRRTFMRRVVGIGVGLLSLEFLAGTFAFLWPNVREGLGGRLAIGSAADIATLEPEWVRGLPFIYNKARLFLVNVPAAKGLVEGGTGAEVPDPGDEVLALYRKCPHLGCQVPQLCDASKWFECLCHGSKYTVLGEKRDGPAPRGMDSFSVTVEEGVYVVDTSEVVVGPPIGSMEFDPRTPDQMQHCAG